MSSTKKNKPTAGTLWNILKEFFTGPPRKYNTAEVVYSIGNLMAVVWKNEREVRLHNAYIAKAEELQKYSDILPHLQEGSREHLLAQLKILDLQEQVIKCANRV